MYYSLTSPDKYLQSLDLSWQVWLFLDFSWHVFNIPWLVIILDLSWHECTNLWLVLTCMYYSLMCPDIHLCEREADRRRKNSVLAQDNQGSPMVNALSSPPGPMNSILLSDFQDIWGAVQVSHDHIWTLSRPYNFLHELIVLFTPVPLWLKRSSHFTGSQDT